MIPEISFLPHTKFNAVARVVIYSATQRFGLCPSWMLPSQHVVSQVSGAREESSRESILALNCLGPSVTCVTSIHILLISPSHLALNSKRSRQTWGTKRNIWWALNLPHMFYRVQDTEKGWRKLETWGKKKKGALHTRLERKVCRIALKTNCLKFSSVRPNSFFFFFFFTTETQRNCLPVAEK